MVARSVYFEDPDGMGCEVVMMDVELTPDAVEQAVAGGMGDGVDVIGEVISGMENVDKMKKGEPVADPDKITRAFVQADGKN